MGAVMSSDEFTRRVVHLFHVGLLKKLEAFYTEGENSLLYFEHGIERFKTDFSRRDLETLKVFWVEIESLNQHQRQPSLTQRIFEENYRASLSKFDMTEEFIRDISFFLKMAGDGDSSTVSIQDVEHFAARNRLVSPCMTCANALLQYNKKERGWEFKRCKPFPEIETPVVFSCNEFRSVYDEDEES